MSFDLPASQWTEEMILEKLQEAIQELKRFPTQEDLRSKNQHKTISAILHSGNSFNYFAEKLGFNTRQKSRGYWTEETILQELKKIKEKHGNIPSVRELRKSKQGGLIRGIQRSGKTLNFYKTLLGETTEVKLTWSQTDIFNNLKEAINSLEKFPTLQELENNGFAKLAAAIKRSKKSIHEYAAALNYIPHEKPKGYWQDFENVKKEIKSIMYKDNFPTQKMIAVTLGGGALKGMYRYHGTLPEIAEKMGYRPAAFFKASDGHFVKSSYEYLLDEYLFSRGIPHDTDRLICEDEDDINYRYDFKVNEIYIEIWGYEERAGNNRCERYAKKRKDKESLYQRLNLKLISLESDFFDVKPDILEKNLDELFSSLGFDVSKKETGIYVDFNQMKHPYYWTLNKTEEELKNLIEKIKTFPTPKQLKELGKGGLADSIKKYGGFEFFRKKLGFELHHRPDGYWTQQRIIDEIAEIIAEIGKFPNYRELKELERSDLIKAIARNGGFLKFQELMGVTPTRKPHGYYTKEVMIEEIKKIRDEIGKIPSYNSLRETHKTLASAIDRSKIGYLNLISEIK